MTSISVYGYDPEMAVTQDTPCGEEKIIPSNVVKGHKLNTGSVSCPFLELPYEVRAHINDYILPYTIRHTTYGALWYRATAPVWSVNRQLYNECISLFYEKCTFRVEVGYDSLSFRFQWAQEGSQGVLYPKRIYKFPDRIAPRNRPLLRRFEIHLHQVESYMGMIKYNYSHPEVLVLGLRKQVMILCGGLQDVPEIRELQIHCEGGDAASHEVLHIALEPFWGLKTTCNVSVQSSKKGLDGVARLQNHLQSAYMKNSLFRLPLELRQAIYTLLLPRITVSSLRHRKALVWHCGHVNILRTSKAVYSEAIRLLYTSNLQQLKDPIHRDTISNQTLQGMCWSSANSHLQTGSVDSLERYLYLLHTYHTSEWTLPKDILTHAAVRGSVAITAPLANRYYPGCFNIVLEDWRIRGLPTQLQVALVFGEYDYITYMLEHGADIKVAMSERVNLIKVAINYRACRKMSEDMALENTRFIVEHAHVKVRGSGGLRVAARRGYLSVVEYLFSKGGDIEDAVSASSNLVYKMSALTEAARTGHVEVIKFLLEHGADIAFRTCGMDGGIPHGTALELAELAGHVEAASVIRAWSHNGQETSG